MAGPGSRRDHKLIDAIEGHASVAFDGPVWRVVRDGRAPTQCSASGGRWDDGSFDVLYTAAAEDGAIAEMYFHLKRGQPIFPSRVRYRLYELRVSLERALRLADLGPLAALGVDTSRYGQLSYQERQAEYPRCQDVGEVAHFLEFDGLIVPSARWDCMNVVLFCDRVPPAAMQATADRGLVDWARWERASDA
ncbi:MAG: RES family NAD+ phosphorylase [Hyphomicrobiales bacterium]|nr:RES family NAD+ phosphorylase [Hyphomicrobiales bacterium]